MKNPKKSAFKILLTVILILLVLIGIIMFNEYKTQINSKSNAQTIENASATFELNNKSQELFYYIEAVDIAIKNKYKNNQAASINKNSFSDSLKLIDEYISFLKKQRFANNISEFRNIIESAENKKKVFTEIINANPPYSFSKIESELPNSGIDNLFKNINSLQLSLESDLKNTLLKTKDFAQSTRRGGTVLSALFILALAILGSFIIKILLSQLTFITKLEVEKDRADKSAMVKEQFLANMSHEIRTPINAVVGFTGLLQKTELNSDQKQFVNLIQHSGQNLLAVVNDILDISKIEAGMMRITNQPFKLKEVCESIRMMFIHKVEEKNLQLILEYDNNIPNTIIGDDDRLKQVLINLINNAIKFTEKGSITISVKQIQTYAGKIKLQIAVKDTGIGIAKEKLATIFERFEQAENNTSRHYGGTGLGLSIVEKIVKLQDGEIRIESEMNVGTIFIVTIDYALAKEKLQSDNLFGKNIATEKDKINLSNYNILIAEDNKINQTLIKYILKQWNVKFDLAENGIEVLEYLRKNTYDLALMDIQMPTMDGYEASTAIRNELKLTLPIIAMTAHIMPTEKQKCISVGMNDYLSKPIDERLLFEMLQKHLPIKENKIESSPLIEPTSKQLYYIDMDYLQNIFSGNDDFIAEILEQFKIQFPQEINQLEKAVRVKDKSMIAKTTHHMKTTVTTLYPQSPIAPILLTIDNNAKVEEWNNVEKEFAKIKIIAPKLMIEIESALKESNKVII